MKGHLTQPLFVKNNKRNLGDWIGSCDWQLTVDALFWTWRNGGPRAARAKKRLISLARAAIRRNESYALSIFRAAVAVSADGTNIFGADCVLAWEEVVYEGRSHIAWRLYRASVFRDMKVTLLKKGSRHHFPRLKKLDAERIQGYTEDIERTWLDEMNQHHIVFSEKKPTVEVFIIHRQHLSVGLSEAEQIWHTPLPALPAKVS